MQLAPEICERARLSRDTRFDGQFFIGVRTTGIYCRPICPAPTAKSENVRYFPSAAAAHESGFRPCLRCRPEAAPGSPAWRGTEVTVTRALRMIEDGALDEGSVEDLAARLGIGERHLRRLFLEHLGAPPLAVAQTRRVHLAKSLLDETDLKMTDIALAAGFGSVRQFNTTIRKTYGQPPSAVRRVRRRHRGGPKTEAFALRLPYREPFDWPGLLQFFAHRAIPGVEAVTGNTYQRTFHIDGARGIVRVEPIEGTAALIARVETDDPRVLPKLVTRLRRQFDLRADPTEIAEHLRRDPRLATAYPEADGMRLPGAFDGFEVAVRGILGQQVTVKGATTISGRIVERCGAPSGDPTTPSIFPTASELADADLENIGMPTARSAAVLTLARAVRDGELILDDTADVGDTRRRLIDLKGIGEWTATYVAMRVLGDPDAFPATDLGLRKALVPGELVAPAVLLERAEAWRPWRGYAAAILWRTLNQTSGG